MAFLTGLTPTTSTSSTWFKNWKLVGAIAFYQPGVSSKVVLGVVNAFELCGVLDIKIIS